MASKAIQAEAERLFVEATENNPQYGQSLLPIWA